jgi:hypothetical protein
MTTHQNPIIEGDLSDEQRSNAAARHDADPGPVPDERPSEDVKRARIIAAIHSIAAWLAAHPEVPIPTDLTFNARAINTDHIHHVAHATAAREYQLDDSNMPGVRHHYAEINLGRPEGISARYVLSTTTHDGPR